MLWLNLLTFPMIFKIIEGFQSNPWIHCDQNKMVTEYKGMNAVDDLR